MKSKVNREQVKRKQNASEKAVELLADYLKEIDFKRNPYRGVMRDLATELGYSSTADLINAAFRSKNPRVLMALARKVKSIETELTDCLPYAVKQQLEGVV